MKIRRMSEEDRSIEAKKEQARLSKHVVCRYRSTKEFKQFMVSFTFSVYPIHQLQQMNR